MGDKPGDSTAIWPTHIELASKIYPELVGHLTQTLRAARNGRVVVAVAGGSGSGKTGVASVLAHYLKTAGVGAYTLSGDNYVWRSPSHNDGERLGRFRLAGALGLANEDLLTPAVRAELQLLQENQIDAAPLSAPWHSAYLAAGRIALEDYLGGPSEIDFAGLSQTLTLFHDGATELWLRRCSGGAEHGIWLEKVDFREVDVMFVEWTHALSESLHGVDIGIYLNSTPEETLARRVARGRDAGADSPFVSLVLEVEQAKLERQSLTAQIVACEKAGILDDWQVVA
jgi:alpha-galactosidase